MPAVPSAVLPAGRAALRSTSLIAATLFRGPDALPRAPRRPGRGECGAQECWQVPSELYSPSAPCMNSPRGCVCLRSASILSGCWPPLTVNLRRCGRQLLTVQTSRRSRVGIHPHLSLTASLRTARSQSIEDEAGPERGFVLTLLAQNLSRRASCSSRGVFAWAVILPNVEVAEVLAVVFGLENFTRLNRLNVSSRNSSP